ncbi:hypothetical protein J4558_27655 [Leptolyngbya sp. 15MV]|nr:hypothetical protein J4558_27655 [Leptolyngbya sp. 15MV]
MLRFSGTNSNSARSGNKKLFLRPIPPAPAPAAPPRPGRRRPRTGPAPQHKAARSPAFSRHRTVEALPAGARIAIPNDPTNGGRALLRARGGRCGCRRHHRQLRRCATRWHGRRSRASTPCRSSYDAAMGKPAGLVDLPAATRTPRCAPSSRRHSAAR